MPLVCDSLSCTFRASRHSCFAPTPPGLLFPGTQENCTSSRLSGELWLQDLRWSRKCEWEVWATSGWKHFHCWCEALQLFFPSGRSNGPSSEASIRLDSRVKRPWSRALREEIPFGRVSLVRVCNRLLPQPSLAHPDWYLSAHTSLPDFGSRLSSSTGMTR